MPEEELPHALPVEDDAPVPKPTGIVGAPRARTEPRAPKPRKWPLRYKVSAWVGGALVVLALLLGGGYALLTRENWQRHESAEGGFGVDVPCRMYHGFPVHNALANYDASAEGGQVWRGTTTYSVSYAHLPHWQNDERWLLDSTAEQVARAASARVTRTTPITVSHCPGREVEYETGSATYLARVVVTSERLFVAVAGGPEPNPGPRRFMDAFEITDPKLTNLYKQRAEMLAEDKRRGEENAAAELKRWAALAAGAHKAPPAGDPAALPGLVLHLSFDEPDPTADAVTKRSVGSFHNGARTGAGVRGRGLAVTDLNSYFDANGALPALRFRAAQPFTLAGWVCQDSLMGSPIFGSAGDDPGPRLWVSFSGPYRESSFAGGPNTRVRDGLNVGSGTSDNDKDWLKGWHHWALVRAPRPEGGESARFYLNGRECGHGGSSKRTTLDALTDLRFGTAPEPWHTKGFGFRGVVDEVCAYHRALSVDEVNYLAGVRAAPPKVGAIAPLLPPFRVEEYSGKPPANPAEFPGLRLHVAGDELKGTAVRERVSGKFVGTAHRPAHVPGPRGPALRVGVRYTDYYGNDGTPGLNLDGAVADWPATAQFTVALWVRLPFEQPLDGPILVARKKTATWPVRFSLWADADGWHALTEGPRPRSISEDYFKVHAPGDRPHRWTHVAYTRDANKRSQLWVNGIGGASEESEADALTAPFLLKVIESTNGPYADFADLCYYERELTAEEIGALAGKAPLPKKK